MTIKSRELNSLIIIEDQKEVHDDLGGYKRIWSKKYNVWAKIESLFNKRQIGHDIGIAKQRKSVDYYQFTIRYKKNISHKMRILWNSKVFNILKIIDLSGKRTFLTLIAEEKF